MLGDTLGQVEGDRIVASLQKLGALTLGNVIELADIVGRVVLVLPGSDDVSIGGSGVV